MSVEDIGSTGDIDIGMKVTLMMDISVNQVDSFHFTLLKRQLCLYISVIYISQTLQEVARAFELTSIMSSE